VRKRSVLVALVGAALAAAVMAPTVIAAMNSAGQSLLAARCHAVELVAHRGMVSPNSLRGPDEDTGLAMVNALRHGASTSESDSRHDRSGTFWEIHDARLNRVGVQTGPIADLSTRQVDGARGRMADGWQHLTRFAAYVHTFMTFDHARFPRAGKRLENEVKPQHFTSVDARRMLLVAARYGATQYLHWSSLVLGELRTLHDQTAVLTRSRELPHAALHTEYQLLVAHGHRPQLARLPRWITKVGITTAAALAPYGPYRTFVGAAHARGIKVNVWNAQHAPAWSALLASQVDAISTNHVDGFRDWCNGQ
jgi:glycerophosphoryl diester phosphodiesterase